MKESYVIFHFLRQKIKSFMEEIICCSVCGNLELSEGFKTGPFMLRISTLFPELLK